MAPTAFNYEIFKIFLKCKKDIQWITKQHIYTLQHSNISGVYPCTHVELNVFVLTSYF